VKKLTYTIQDKGTFRSKSIYDKLNIASELNCQVNEQLCKYALVRYWLLMHGDPLDADELDILRRYVEVANLLGELKDHKRFLQLVKEVPELKMLVKIFDDMENNKPTATAQSRCSDCVFYSGDSGNKTHHVMCAVNIPKPTAVALKKAKGSLPDAWHDCKDFESAIVPVMGGFSAASTHRCYSLEEEDEDLEELTSGCPGYYDENCPN
jgi:hypothetical protein